MADRFPLILNTNTNQIQEIASGDQLDLSGNNVANAGIITATTFSGNLTGNVTGNVTGNINGNLTGTLQTAAQPNITSIGTLSSLNVTGNASIGGVLTYEDVTNIDSVGIITARKGIVSSGVVTATSFVGDGSNLTGLASDKIEEGNTKAEVIDTGSDGRFVVTTEGAEKFSIDSVGDFTFNAAHDNVINANGNLTIDYKMSNSTKFRWMLQTYDLKLYPMADDYPINIWNSDVTKQIKVFRTGEVNVGYGISLSGTTGNINATGIVTATAFKLADGSTVGGIESDAQSNTIGGTTSGASFQGTSAINNTLFGFNSGRDITTGDHNSGFGDRSLYKLTTGSDNTALGQSLYNATTGTKNVGTGNWSLFNLTTGSNNNAYGYQTLDSVTTADNNSAFGHRAAEGVTTGTNNCALGYEAGHNLTTGSNNIIIGANTDASSVTVSNEITLGDGNITKFRIPGINFTLKDNGGTPTQGHVLTVDGSGEASFAAGGVTSDSDNNTVGGSGAGDSITSGSGLFNTCFGKDAGTGITSGDYNTAIGGNAYKSGNGRLNVFIGYNAGSNANSSGDGNAIVGNTAAYALTSGANNAVLGYMAAEDITSASNSTLVGMSAGLNITSGEGNTLIGYQAGQNIQTSVKNVAIGKGTLNGVVSGYGNNISIGERSMFSCGSNVDNLIAIGYEALKSHQGSTNSIAIGTDALETSTTGRNIGIGRDAGANVTDGSQNTILGYRAGDILTSGDNNIIIGDDADPSSATVSNEITLGNSSIAKFRIPGCGGFEIDTNGHTLPGSDNASDLGSSSKRWRNVYTTDLQLSNEGMKNDVDNTWGNYTIQEGESDLFLINNRSGKKYKFNLTEVS